MKKKILSVIKYLVFLAIGVALVWWQISKMTEAEKEQFITSLKTAHYIYVIPIVALGLLSHYVRALRWKLLINPIGKVSISNAFYATLIGYLSNTFLPRAGEILRCTMLSRYEKVTFTQVLGTVIVERLFDLITFAVFVFLTVIIQVDTVREFISNAFQSIASHDSGWPLWLKISILIGFLLILYFIISQILKRFSNNKIIRKLKEFWHGLKEGLSTIFHLKQRGPFLFYTVAMWFLYLMEIYVGFRALDITSHLGVPVAMSVLTLSTVAMIITPGGLGAFPVAVQHVLLIYNTDNLSFGWLVWSVNTGIIILAGLVSLVLMVYQNKNNYEKIRRNQSEDLQTGNA